MVKNCMYKNCCLLYYKQRLKTVVNYLIYVIIKTIAYYILGNGLKNYCYIIKKTVANKNKQREQMQRYKNYCRIF